ncbi:MAG: hypothetical protein ACLPHP_22815 [Candidatus Sulfotelmatobacter sp.]
MSRGRHRWLVRVFLGRDRETRRRRYHNLTIWAKREEQIHGVFEATAGMYGDLQGIAGKNLDEIEGLELALPAGDERH